MSQSTLSNDLEANDIDFFKKKFAVDTLKIYLQDLKKGKAIIAISSKPTVPLPDNDEEVVD